MGIPYKREIDGLRAIAVLAVVAYHAGVGGAGFVGVDVFFVISGYLITSLLMAERARTGSIDLLAFYARRVRRIVPAAAVVVLAVLVASVTLLPVDAQQQTARSAGAALAFVANFFFQATTGGYWDSAADEMPLLHLWSLSVEEQFYLLWPALLLVTRSPKAMLVLALLSFGLAEFWIVNGSDAAFFQMPARFWELAIGGMIAACPPQRLPRWLGGAGVVATLAACIWPVAHFPGYGALPAVLAASAVLACVHGSGRIGLLASRPMVGVGLVSYSLYLWHWPLLAIYAVRGGNDSTIRALLCVLALPLAVLTWRFVEMPVRRMRVPSGRTVAAGVALSSVLALGACAIGLRETPESARSALAERALADHAPKECIYKEGEAIPKCPDPAGATIVVWGDSMAWSWGAAFDEPARVYSFAGCLPAVGRNQVRRGCDAWNDAVLRHLKGDTLYLVARWNVYANSKGMDTTFNAVRNFRRVVVIGPVPHLPASPDRCIRGEGACAISRAAFDDMALPRLAELRALAAPYPNIEVVDVSAQFCTSTQCPMIVGDTVLFHDEDHPSASQVKRAFRLNPRLHVDAR